MNIGIIGAGNIGGALTRRLRTLGHDVAVANWRGPESLRDLAAETGASAVTPAQAARGKDLAVVTIPLKEHLGAAEGFAGRRARDRRGRHEQLLPAPARRLHRADRSRRAREPMGWRTSSVTRS